MSDYVKEMERLVSDLIDAAHGTVMTEDQEREDTARAALLAHIERSCYPLSRPVDNNGRVPDGWKLVPIEPTDAMLDVAVSFALCVQISGEYGWSRYMADVWKRMYSAAPSAPAAPVEPSEVSLPEPDTHCYDDDEQRDVWSYSKGMMIQYGNAREVAGYARGVAEERERCAAICDRMGNPLNVKYEGGGCRKAAAAIRAAQKGSE